MADLTVTATLVVPVTGSPIPGTFGETITAGQAVYLKSSDGRLWKAQCDGTAAEADAVGIALNGGAAGQTGAYAGTGATINIGATTAKTTAYMVSATAGGVAPQADLVGTNKIVYLGYATATDGSFTINIRNTGASV